MSLVRLSALVLGVVVVCAGSASAHDEVLIARTSSNQLTMHTHGMMPFELPASVFPGITGFADAEVAFQSLEMDDPGEDIFTLPATVDIRCVLLQTSPNMRVYNGLNPMQVGEEIVLGAPVIHHLPIWNITQGSPGEQSFAVFQFRDASNQLTTSAPFFLTFTPVPAPGAAVALGAGMLVAARRRR